MKRGHSRFIHAFQGALLLAWMGLPAGRAQVQQPDLQVRVIAGQPALMLSGTPGTVYSIQFAASLSEASAWSDRTLLQAHTNATAWSDPSVGSVVDGFYRAVSVPAPADTNFVFIQPGTFVMGSPTNELSRDSTDEVQHNVTISRGFWMGRYLVTQAEYLAVVGKNPSWFGSGTAVSNALAHPVEQVNWFDATNYCFLRTEQEQTKSLIPANFVYRLPMEAEWEYSCRAGTTTAYYVGNRLLSGQANFNGEFQFDALTGVLLNSHGLDLSQTSPVGSFPPNPWGLYDMIGNVWEWCQDWYAPFSVPVGSMIDPHGANSGRFRLIRGGSWFERGSVCRSATRWYITPDYSSYEHGFRVVLAQANSLPTAPSMLAQPQSQSVQQGATVSFTATATGTLPLSYQWQHNGTNLLENGRITGTSSNVLQIANAQAEDAGDYTMVASNSGAVVTSRVAALVVDVPGSTPTNPDPANLVWIAPGNSTMGSSTNEGLRTSDEVQHSVTITRGFWMQKYLVTQQDYMDAVGSNPSHFTAANGFPGPLTRPVELVSWEDATNYCALRTKAARAAGSISTNDAYRLPTEAEWEYACRAGTTTAFYLGDRLLSGDANFNGLLEYDAQFGLSQNPEGADPGQPTPVGSYPPNGWGLYDIIGNVWEWCQDWYGPYLDQSVTDPPGPASGTMRVIRGGSWGASPILCRSAQRRALDPANHANSNIGFRVVLSAAAP